MTGHQQIRSLSTSHPQFDANNNDNVQQTTPTSLDERWTMNDDNDTDDADADLGNPTEPTFGAIAQGG